LLISVEQGSEWLLGKILQISKASSAWQVMCLNCCLFGLWTERNLLWSYGDSSQRLEKNFSGNAKINNRYSNLDKKEFNCRGIDALN